MAGTRICKVCDKEYEYCRNAAKPGPFRWQDVACCAEHGAIYFERVMRARGMISEDEASPAADEPKSTKKTKAKKAAPENDTVLESAASETEADAET